jgi:hypothetical protein
LSRPSTSCFNPVMAGGWVYFMTIGATASCMSASQVICLGEPTNIGRGLLMDLPNTTA